MSMPEIFESEYRFMLLLWENEPISSAKLAEICKEKLDWSRTTTYTVIRRLRDRGILNNDSLNVSSVFTKEDVQLSRMNALIDKTFENSLPTFITAFARRQNLSDEEYEALKALLTNRPGKEENADH